MMNTSDTCPPSEQLIDLLYGELEQTASDRLRTHMTQCAACSLELETLERTLAAADELEGAAVQPHPSVLFRLHDEVLQARPLWRRLLGDLLERLRSPVPAYRAAFLGAVAMLAVTQLPSLLQKLEAPSSPAASSHEASAGRAAAPIEPPQADPEVLTPLTADSLPADQLVNAY